MQACAQPFGLGVHRDKGISVSGLGIGTLGLGFRNGGTDLPKSEGSGRRLGTVGFRDGPSPCDRVHVVFSTYARHSSLFGINFKNPIFEALSRFVLR